MADSASYHYTWEMEVQGSETKIIFKDVGSL